MYNYYINSAEIFDLNDGIGVTSITNERLVTIYNRINYDIVNKTYGFQQSAWDDIIVEEGLTGRSCIHDNLLYFNIAKDLVWDILLMKLHVPTTTKDKLYEYYDVKSKALFLNTYGIDLYS